jgi:outer membrane immunogenic protein
MKKLLLAAAAVSLASIAGPALAADMPLKMPWAAPAPGFSWTSCYLGAHIGGGWVHKDITDPVELVQDAFLGGVTTGVTTVQVSPNGLVIGGQMGCDYQFDYTNWVLGAEGAVSGANLRGNTNVAMPLGNPGDIATVTAKTDFLPSVTARLGYALGPWLLYVRGGAAWAGDKYSVTGTFLGAAYGFEGLDNRFGWTGGGGVEWAFADLWSARLEYDYAQLGHHSSVMTDAINGLSGVLDVKQSVQTVKLGVNFHMWYGQ